jgi:tRNA(Ile)-lysidine synthase
VECNMSRRCALPSHSNTRHFHRMTASSPVSAAVAALLRREPSVVLAVSGGVDSMVLLHAAAREIAQGAEARVIIATFDHGTGTAATAAAALVRRVAGHYSLEVVSGFADVLATASHLPASAAVDESDDRGRDTSVHATYQSHDEAGWRTARWRFLREVAQRHQGTIVTAHTRDDQLETIAMRILRSAGARGLAGLYAKSDIQRPLLGIGREEIIRYALEHDVQWVEDPTNASRRYFRNRVRHDLLPALEAAHPSFSQSLLELGTRAAALRNQIDVAATSVLVYHDKEAHVSRSQMSRVPDEARPYLWQALAAREGIILDWRGTKRLADQAGALNPGGCIPLSGGFEVIATFDTFFFRRRTHPSVATHHEGTLSLQRVTMFGAWRFSPVTDATINGERPATTLPQSEAQRQNDLWSAWLPAKCVLAVRVWTDGDRVATDESLARRRRVTRYFADRRIPASDRVGWPVVLAGDEIIWIPGIRRTLAATARSGRPGVCILCERLDR